MHRNEAFYSSPTSANWAHFRLNLPLHLISLGQGSLVVGLMMGSRFQDLFHHFAGMLLYCLPTGRHPDGVFTPPGQEPSSEAPSDQSW
ncbi:MAG: hypothetical protein EXR21_05115 [Flavobacteriaceae bacterium]|nr:hypothetical protein [Flavobacteriaceae bacterium]